MMNRVQTEIARRIAAEYVQSGVMAIAEKAFEAGLSYRSVTSRMGMTPAQRDLLAFIASFIEAHDGVPPSFDEMKDALGLKSKSGIHRLILALEERGKIARLPNRARCIEIVRNAA